MGLRFSFDWNPDRGDDAIRAVASGLDRFRFWTCAVDVGNEPEANAEVRGNGACASIDINDFCDDMDFFIEGLRRGFAEGYTCAERDEQDLAGLEKLAAEGNINAAGVRRLAELREAKSTNLGTRNEFAEEAVSA